VENAHTRGWLPLARAVRARALTRALCSRVRSAHSISLGRPSGSRRRAARWRSADAAVEAMRSPSIA